MRKFLFGSIKHKVFFACIALSLIPLVCIIAITGIFLERKSYNDFIERTNAEITQFDNAITIFVDNAGLNLEMMCSHPALKRINGNLNFYMDRQKPVLPRDITSSPVEKELFDHFSLIMKTHAEYVELYLGGKDGASFPAIQDQQYRQAMIRENVPGILML